MQRGLPDAPPLYSQDAFFVASALEDLARYISGSSNERETKDRQKLLRNLRILEMIISILGLFDPDAHDSRSVYVRMCVCVTLCMCVCVYV